MCSLCRLPVTKKTILGNFWYLGDSCTDTLLPMMAKFDVLEQTRGLHLQAYFTWIRSSCRLPVAKNHTFRQILTFLGLLYRPPFTDKGRVWCAIADLRCTFTCEISSPSVYSVVLWGWKTAIFAVFWLRRLVMSSIGTNLRKLSNGAQLQTFPHLTASKSFLCSNAFMAKSGAQCLTFKSVTDKVTNRQTKTQRFWPRLRRLKSEPHQTWHGDRGPRTRTCT